MKNLISEREKEQARHSEIIWTLNRALILNWTAKEDWKTQSKKKGGHKAKKINQTLRTLRTGKTKEKTKQRQKNLEDKTQRDSSKDASGWHASRWQTRCNEKHPF